MTPPQQPSARIIGCVWLVLGSVLGLFLLVLLVG